MPTASRTTAIRDASRRAAIACARASSGSSSKSRPVTTRRRATVSAIGRASATQFRAHCRVELVGGDVVRDRRTLVMRRTAARRRRPRGPAAGRCGRRAGNHRRADGRRLTTGPVIAGPIVVAAPVRARSSPRGRSSRGADRHADGRCAAGRRAACRRVDARCGHGRPAGTHPCGAGRHAGTHRCGDGRRRYGSPRAAGRHAGSHRCADDRPLVTTRTRTVIALIAAGAGAVIPATRTVIARTVIARGYPPVRGRSSRC